MSCARMMRETFMISWSLYVVCCMLHIGYCMLERNGVWISKLREGRLLFFFSVGASKTCLIACVLCRVYRNDLATSLASSTVSSSSSVHNYYCSHPLGLDRGPLFVSDELSYLCSSVANHTRASRLVCAHCIMILWMWNALMNTLFRVEDT